MHAAAICPCARDAAEMSDVVQRDASSRVCVAPRRLVRATPCARVCVARGAAESRAAGGDCARAWTERERSDRMMLSVVWRVLVSSRMCVAEHRAVRDARERSVGTLTI